jgi:hypothetical protein
LTWVNTEKRGYSLQTSQKQVISLNIKKDPTLSSLSSIKKEVFKVGCTDVLKRFYLNTARGESDLNDTGEICSTQSYITQHIVRAMKAPVFAAADSKLG